MNVRLMRAKKMEAPKSDRRREPRFAAGVEGTLFLSDASATVIRIAEISLHGCRVSGVDDAELRTGMFVSIALGDESPLETIVRWVRDGNAGMEFLWPISPDRREWHDLVDLTY